MQGNAWILVQEKATANCSKIVDVLTHNHDIHFLKLQLDWRVERIHSAETGQDHRGGRQKKQEGTYVDIRAMHTLTATEQQFFGRSQG